VGSRYRSAARGERERHRSGVPRHAPPHRPRHRPDRHRPIRDRVVGTGPYGTGSYGNGPFGNGPSGPVAAVWPSGYPGQDDVSSHTLVVHREDERSLPGAREPFLQRWLFSPRLLIVVLILVLGVGLGLGGWWLTTGRYARCRWWPGTR
jgi:hypothetical protein